MESRIPQMPPSVYGENEQRFLLQRCHCEPLTLKHSLKSAILPDKVIADQSCEGTIGFRLLSTDT